ncbi:MAG TPA: LLM class flavin-dependent oxidoreductase [Thermoplasmata archaeon]|nr:LLM class flavin-dependent oxidoreductase [Thermoplasmata archaeon]
MRLGAFTVVDAYPDRTGGDLDRLSEVVRLAEEAEVSGLSSFWVAEHHFHTGGICPSPPVLLAACGMRTRTIRLGSLVSVLPFHRPVDLAEEYALVDRLVGGRLNLGVGSGYIASEFAGYGLDPADKRRRFDAALETMLEAFAGRPVRAGGDGSTPSRLNVLPVQKPHPPLWIAVQRREAIPHVARRGASVALIPYATVDTLDELAAEIDDYRRALPPGAAGEVAVALHIYAGEHVGRAREAFRRYVQSRLETGSTFFERKSRDRPAHATPEAIEQSGFALFGPPADIAQGMDRFARIGVDELLGIFDFGGLAHEEVVRSIRAVGAARLELRSKGPPTRRKGPAKRADPPPSPP